MCRLEGLFFFFLHQAHTDSIMRDTAAVNSLVMRLWLNGINLPLTALAQRAAPAFLRSLDGVSVFSKSCKSIVFYVFCVFKNLLMHHITHTQR